jgi:hypothetical protein
VVEGQPNAVSAGEGQTSGHVGSKSFHYHRLTCFSSVLSWKLEISMISSAYPHPMDTQLSAASLATHQALAIPEILECILLHLPLRDILSSAQRVNTLFRGIIDFSVSLQTALFFKPSFPKISVPNPLLPYSSHSIFIDLRPHASPPFVSLKHLVDFPWPSDPGESLPQLSWSSWIKNKEVWERRGASWRRMLVVQPPIIELELRNEIIKCGGGVKMGALEMAHKSSWSVTWMSFRIDGSGKGELLAR